MDSHRNRVEGNRSAYNGTGYGLLLVGSTYNEVIDNFIDDTDNHAIVLRQSDHNLLEGNTAISDYDLSVELSESHENRVIGNSALYGIALSSSHRNLIAGNRISGNEEHFPLSIWGHFNRIEANVITSTWRSDEWELHEVTLDGDHNQVTGNVIVGAEVDSRPRSAQSPEAADGPSPGLTPPPRS